MSIRLIGGITLVFLAVLGNNANVQGKLVASDLIKGLHLVSKGPYLPYVSGVSGFGNWTSNLPEMFNPGTVRRQGAVSYTLLMAGCKARFSKYPGEVTITHVRGSPVHVYLLNPHNRKLTKVALGAKEKDCFVVNVPPGVYVALELKHLDRPRQFALLSLLILPQFEENDLEATNQNELFSMFPEQVSIIQRLNTK